jgi:hypothetical protein
MDKMQRKRGKKFHTENTEDTEGTEKADENRDERSFATLRMMELSWMHLGGYTLVDALKERCVS